MNIVLKACNVNLRIIIVSVICYFISHSHSHSHFHSRSYCHSHFHSFSPFSPLPTCTRMYARTHVILYLSISFAISIVLWTKISLSILCLLKDEISHLLNPLLKLPNKIELIVSSFFSPFSYLLRRFPHNGSLA